MGKLDNSESSVDGMDSVSNVVSAEHNERSTDVLYSVDDVPPLSLSILMGFQNALQAVNGNIMLPMLLAPIICMDKDFVGLAELIGTSLFIAGLLSIIQTTIGVRLPIIQGATFAFLTPAFSILGLEKWKCDYTIERETDPLLLNSTLPPPGSPEHRDMWMLRIREIQGAIMVSAFFEVVVGFSGLAGLIIKFVGPLAITPTITLIGLSMFSSAADKAAAQWYIAFMTVFLVAFFSQYLRNVYLPCCIYEKGKGMTTVKMPLFSLFPVLLAIIVSWVVCVILTAAGALPEKEGEWGYLARTDIKTEVLYKSEWFRLPYPCQWGVPTISTAGVFGMLAGVVATIVESIGDYYACAKLSGAPPPPIHAINRGMITAVGLTNLQYVNLNSSRNIFILGVSLFLGLSFPEWVASHSDAIDTGSDIADQIITVLLSTSMFVGGFTGLILDNTIPGTDEERGILKWRKQESANSGNSIYTTDMRTYDLPLIQNYLDKITICRYLPFCPTFGHGRLNTNDVERNAKASQDFHSEMTNTTDATNTHL